MILIAETTAEHKHAKRGRSGKIFNFLKLYPELLDCMWGLLCENQTAESIYRIKDVCIH